MLLVRFFVAVCHRRFGKTEFAIVKLVGSALRLQLPRGEFAYIGPLLKQAKKVAWVRLKEYTKHIPGANYNESELWVEFRNAGGHKSRITVYGADNPDGLRGIYLDGAVLDEVAQMRPDVWKVIIRPMMVDRRGWALFIGTPEGENLFKEVFDYAGTDLNWDRVVFRASETVLPWVTQEEKENCLREQGEEYYNQEFECDFYARVYNILIPLSDVERACGRIVMSERELAGYPKVLGVDVARFGHHRSAIAKRWGPWYLRVERWRGIDTMELASEVVRMNAEWKPDAIFIDEGGVGGGVIDRCRQVGVDVIGVQFGGASPTPMCANKRTYMWETMRVHIKEIAVLDPTDSEMKTELSSQTYQVRNDQRMLEAKEGDPEQNKLRRRPLKSPDLGDAMALTHAMPVAPKKSPAYEDFVEMGRWVDAKELVPSYRR